MPTKVTLLRIVHGAFALYFLICLAYIYFAAITATFDLLLAVALISLSIEGLVVFVLNHGECPLIYIQRRLGDDTPFFELFLPPNIAKKAIPFFAILGWVGLSGLIVRAVLSLALVR